MNIDKAATNLMDEIAETLHNVWWCLRIEDGDTLGPRGFAKKQHPHLIPWSAKSEQERAQDRYQAVKVMEMYRSNPSANVNDIAREIHIAAREFVYASRRGPLSEELKAEWTDNPRPRKERGRQAALVLLLLHRFRDAGGWNG